jgi:hypothetical protein
MCPVIHSPANSKIRAVIQFLHDKSATAAEIHNKLWALYGQNVMHEGTIG